MNVLDYKRALGMQLLLNLLWPKKKKYIRRRFTDIKTLAQL